MTAEQYRYPYLDSSVFIAWLKGEVVKDVDRKDHRRRAGRWPGGVAPGDQDDREGDGCGCERSIECVFHGGDGPPYTNFTAVPYI